MPGDDLQFKSLLHEEGLMRSNVLATVVVLGLLLVTASISRGTTLLYVQGGYNVNYHAANDTTFCNRLDNLFGALNITVVSTATNDFSTILSYDRVFIGVGGSNGDYHPDRPDHLTTTQQTNLAAFIATGKRVVLIGEWSDPNWSNWRNWDLSLLSVLGTTVDDGPDFTPYGFSAFPSTRTPTAPTGNPGTADLVAGVTAVVPALSGGVVGGTQVFQVHIISLLGPQSNVLYSGDSELFTDPNLILTSDGSNRTFIRNTATWLWGPEDQTGVAEGGPGGSGATPDLDSNLRWLAFPNPARAGHAAILLRAKESQGSELLIVDASGRMVRRLECSATPGGPGEAAWDGRDGHGRVVSAGIYFFLQPTQSRASVGHVTIVR